MDISLSLGIFVMFFEQRILCIKIECLFAVLRQESKMMTSKLSRGCHVIAKSSSTFNVTHAQIARAHCNGLEGRAKYMCFKRMGYPNVKHVDELEYFLKGASYLQSQCGIQISEIIDITDEVDQDQDKGAFECWLDYLDGQH